MKIRFFTTLFLILIFSFNTVYAETDITQLINQDNSLSKDYIPDDLIVLENIPTSREIKISKKMNSDLQKMYQDIIDDDIIDFYIVSGFRDFNHQESLFQDKIKENINKGYSEERAREEASTVVAIPGTSEHQSGLALDFSADGSLEYNFANTSIGKWLKSNAHKYGFILRYPENKTDITKIIYEPWHFRYVGKELSQKLYEKELCLEEYYAPTQNVKNKLSNILSILEVENE